MSKPIVLDASALLALLFQERGSDVVERHLANAVMSAVNVAEVISKLVDKGLSERDAAKVFVDLMIPVRAFSEKAALETGRLRRLSQKSGLSLGDRACLAEAFVSESTVLTADKLWSTLPLDIPIEVIR